MRIADLMTADPITVASDATATTAAKVMRDHDLGSLPVVEGDRLVGFVTDRDIIVRCVAEDGDCPTKPITEIMSPSLHCCREDQSPQEAMELMASGQVHRLPVVNADDRLVGIISIGKLAESSGDTDTVCTTIKAVRQPVGA